MKSVGELEATQTFETQQTALGGNGGHEGYDDQEIDLLLLLMRNRGQAFYETDFGPLLDGETAEKQHDDFMNFIGLVATDPEFGDDFCFDKDSDGTMLFWLEPKEVAAINQPLPEDITEPQAEELAAVIPISADLLYPSSVYETVTPISTGSVYPLSVYDEKQPSPEAELLDDEHPDTAEEDLHPKELESQESGVPAYVRPSALTPMPPRWPGRHPSLAFELALRKNNTQKTILTSQGLSVQSFRGEKHIFFGDRHIDIPLAGVDIVQFLSRQPGPMSHSELVRNLESLTHKRVDSYELGRYMSLIEFQLKGTDSFIKQRSFVDHPSYAIVDNMPRDTTDRPAPLSPINPGRAAARR